MPTVNRNVNRITASLNNTDDTDCLGFGINLCYYKIDDKLVNLNASNLNIETKIIDQISARQSVCKDNLVTLDIGKVPVTFHLDTGAEISIISRNMIPDAFINNFRGTN